MRNNDIFTDRHYDMVVAVTFDALNRQLKKLADKGIINDTFVFEMGVDKNDNWVPNLRASFGDVEKDERTGIPHNETIFGTYRPYLQPYESSPNVEIGVIFTSGTMWWRSRNGFIMSADITGWTFKTTMRIDLVQIENEPMGAASDVVRKRLHEFTSEGFAVSQLFCDLQSVDLITKGSDVNTLATTNGSATRMFKEFMLEGYLKYIQNNPKTNPYTLGYVKRLPRVEAANQDDQVPDSLKPVGNTFSTFYDANDPSRSTLNFICNVKDSTDPPGSADRFDTNWLSPTDVCHGKMIYSFRALLETLVLREFYDSYTSSMYQQISQGGITIFEPSKPYEKAVSQVSPGKYHFDVHKQDFDTNNENRYVTWYDASFHTTARGFAVELRGSIYWYKENHKSVNFLGKPEKARAWVGATTVWTSTIDIALGSDSAGKPVLEMSTSRPSVESYNPINPDSNGVAKSLARWEDMLGSLLDVGGIFFLFNPVQWVGAGLLALRLIKFPSKITAHGVQLDLALKNLPKASAATVYLAAGDVFEYKNVAVIPDTGATTMLVDYKEEIIENGA